MVVQMTREEKRKLLNDHGFHWNKDTGSWRLLDRNDKETNEQTALQLINEGRIAKLGPVFVYDDRLTAQLLSRTLFGYVPVFLDTETTGTGPDDEIIDIAIVDFDGTVLVDQLVNPTMPISAEAREKHGLDSVTLSFQPDMIEIWPAIYPILRDRPILIYNSMFDLRLLRQTTARYNLEMPEVKAHDVMKVYALYHGEKTRESDINYAAKKLEVACETFGIQPGTHRALADAEATRQVLIAMARA
jgi:DNA polymerase-3 subunit epsilon